MKMRNAVRYAILGASITVPALSMAAGGMPVFGAGDCVESINEGGMIQESCTLGGNQYFRTTISDAEFTSTSVVGTGTAGGGLALTSEIVNADFEANTTINTGQFLTSADNSGLHILEDGFVAAVSNSQWVDLGPEFVTGGANPDGHTLFLRFENKSAIDLVTGNGSADIAGNTGMTRFFNQMNSPSAGGSRYAADTRYLDLSNEGTFIDISVPDSLISFRLQRATVAGEVNEYLRFGSRSGSVPKAEANGAWSRFTVAGVESELFGNQQSVEHFHVLRDLWQAQAEGYLGTPEDVQDFMANFRDFTALPGAAPTAVDDLTGLDPFFENTNYPYAATAFLAADFAAWEVDPATSVFDYSNSTRNPNNIPIYDPDFSGSVFTNMGNNSWNYSGPF